MSLINEFMTECVFMNKAKVPDGQGGFTTEWTDGAPIKIAIVHNSTLQARIAEKEGVTSTYTLTTTRENKLEFHDVIKRLSDNAIFRVTSNAEDRLSPQVSTLNMAQVSAERYRRVPFCSR